MKRNGILTGLVLLLLSGCGLFQHEEGVDVIQLAENLLAAQKDQYGDPVPVHLPVRINYSVSHKPQVGREMRIDFEFIAEKAIPVLRIGIGTSDGLELVSSDLLQRYQNIKPRQSFSKSVVVEPQAENEFYLSLYVVSEDGDRRLAELIRIPIAIGDYALKNIKRKQP